MLLVKNACLRGEKALKDILIDGGKIKEIAKKIDSKEGIVIDAQGNLVTPPLVDPHVHLDAVLVAGLLQRKNETLTSGTSGRRISTRRR